MSALPDGMPVSSAAAEPLLTGRFWGSVLRFVRYALGRLVILAITVVVGLYFALLVANLGGKIDEVHRANILWQAGNIVGQDPAHRDKTPAERVALARQLAAKMEEASGLNRHIMLRTAEWLPQGLTLQLGESLRLRSLQPRMPSERRVVRLLILERIPNTLLLMGVTNLLYFFVSLSVGLFLSRRYQSWLDKLFVWLSPMSTVPGWFYGVFLITIFAGMLRWFPFGGMYPVPPPESSFLYALGVLRHTVLPFFAVFLSVFFYSVYAWRTFFLIYAGEDYVEMAEAKGLPERSINRRYILRPTLPTILTSLVVTMIGIWSGSVLLEQLFAWPGLGDLYYRAIVVQDTAVIVGLTVVYAYLLAITIFVLEIAYGLVDPRIRLGGKEKAGRSRAKVARATRLGRLRLWPFSRVRRSAAGSPYPQQTRNPAPGRAHRFSVTRGLQRAAEDAWQLVVSLRRLPKWLVTAFGELRYHPTAIVGAVIILFLSLTVVYTLIALPYEEAIQLWRGDEADWHDVPRNARPVWINYFSRTKLPESVVMDSRIGESEKAIDAQPGFKDITLTYTFDFPYDAFPQEPLLYLYPDYDEKLPHVTLRWITPDHREIQLAQLSPRNRQLHRFSDDTRLMRRLGEATVQEGVFGDPNAATLAPLPGQYQLHIEALLFEDDADFDAKLVVPGQVYGWAGTDNRRRDLSIALLWGTPIALGFGLLAAFSTTFLTMVLAAVGVWWGGMVDDLVQRITEVNMVLPVFPVLAMFTALFTLRIWTVLGLAIAFSVFGSSLKTYRALFLQVKTAPYIEAAQAYGAKSWRIVMRYLVPRVLPVLVPQIMILVPSYVFLETALAFLGLSDIYLPTWGKVIHEALQGNALLNGHYHWVLQPSFLLLLTAFAFAMLGFTLDRVFNPRLREI